jgi:thiol-disulfide isomerase/thioredoxin
VKAWLLALAACGTPAAQVVEEPKPPPTKMEQINKPGAVVDIEAGLVNGYVTVVDFWSESCGACHIVGAKLVEGVANEPKILIRKVDVGDALTPVAEHYDIGGLPHYRVYDKKKQMRYLLVGNDCLKAPELAKQLLAEP